nr:NfeD family protein [Pseudomonas sp.]
HGEIWQAVSEQPLPAQATVRITRRDGLVLTVAPHDNTPQGD